MAGLASARERGRVGGRRAKLSESQSIIAEQLFNERQLSVNEIARSLGVSRSTVYRNLK
jgi:DNA invertase Pin-like site-specific DNA recombinase